MHKHLLLLDSRLIIVVKRVDVFSDVAIGGMKNDRSKRIFRVYEQWQEDNCR